MTTFLEWLSAAMQVAGGISIVCGIVTGLMGGDRDACFAGMIGGAAIAVIGVVLMTLVAP